MNRLLVIALVFLSCSDQVDSIEKPDPSQCLVIDGIEKLRTLNLNGLNIHYPEVLIQDSQPLNFSNNDIDIINILNCDKLTIKSDSVTFRKGNSRADSLTTLIIESNVLETECPIMSRFPSLDFIKLKIDNPYGSSFFHEGFKVNTLFIIGKYNSTSFLASPSCEGSQLILESNNLINLDSLHLNRLKFSTINIQLTPLSSRLDSIYPVHEDIYKSLGIADSTVFVF
jgi:hypothetical protein